MPFLTKGKTNWKYILIVSVLAVIVGGGIFGYLRYSEKEIISLTQFIEIKKPKKIKKGMSRLDILGKWYILASEQPEGYLIFHDDGTLEFPEWITQHGKNRLNWLYEEDKGLLKISFKSLPEFFPENKEIANDLFGNVSEPSIAQFVDYNPEELSITLKLAPETRTIEFFGWLFSKVEEETANWKTYRNEEYGFEIKYPEWLGITELPENKITDLGVLPWLINVRFIKKGTREIWGELAVRDFNRVTDTWCQSRGGAFSGSIEIGGQKRLKCFHPEFGATRISEYSVFIGQRNNLFFDFWCSDLSKSRICDQILSSFRFIEKSEKITKEEELCFKGTFEGSIMKEIKDDSLRSLILKVVTQELQNLGYEKEEICKIQRFIFNTPLGVGGKVDLNEDGIPEFILSLDCFYIENKPHCIGGTSGSPIFVFGFVQGKWKLIGRLEGSRVIALKTRRSGGYFNLVTHSPMGTCCGYFSEFSWKGEEYGLIRIMEYDHEKGFDNVDPEIWNAYYEQIGG